VVISASRRTDIPAFYGSWLQNRIRAGFCEVVNPFNGSQVSRVSLAPEDVDALVLWTRYPKSILQKLPAIIEAGYPVAALFTIVDYPSVLEPAMPPLGKRVDAFKRMVESCGPGAVVWRYDPVILSNTTPPEYHQARFARIADELQGWTERVIVSAFQPYRSVLRRLSALGGIDLEDHSAPAARLREVVAGLAGVAARHGMEMQSCADPRLSGVSGVSEGGCIDARLLRAAGFEGRLPDADPHQRDRCRCLRSRDIGAYETCLFGCRYCYATHGDARARRNAAVHDPNAARLVPAAVSHARGRAG
jgi:DNA repair photolyase